MIADVDDPTAVAAACREDAVRAMANSDWDLAYAAAKLLVARGGGAWTPEAWLLYAVSAVLLGQPRTGVRSMDVALSNWIEAAPDRCVLHWARGSLVMRQLKDPKTALADYDAAQDDCPDWLAPILAEDLVTCAEAAASSRKKKPAVAPAPSYEPRFAHDTVAPRDPRHTAGAQPPLWSHLIQVLRPGQSD